MNNRQKLFVQNYLISLNATDAAIKAGYSEKTAYSIGQRLLKHVEIKSYINQRLRKAEEKADVTVEYILTGLKEVAERCMQKKPVMIRNGKQMVQKTDKETGEGIWEFDSSGSNRSLELLGKYKAMFTDKVDNTHKFDISNLTVEERKKILAEAIEELNKEE